MPPSGRLTAKTSRQLQSPSAVSTNPPITGPRIVVSDEAADQMPIAQPRSLARIGRGDDREAAGHHQRRAEPLHRARDDQEHRRRARPRRPSRPTTNSTMPMANTLRMPKRSPAAPPISSSEERNSR